MIKRKVLKERKLSGMNRMLESWMT